MSTYLRAAGRVLIVLAAAVLVGLSLFAVMQLVVHPLMGPPRRQQFAEGQRPPGIEREGVPGRPGGENGFPRRIRLRTLAGLVARIMLFGAVTVFVVVIQKLFFNKQWKFLGWSRLRSPPQSE
ncbi:MAG: hypothetical protein ACM3QS_14695 [Bacteroidota bacterium]